MAAVAQKKTADTAKGAAQAAIRIEGVAADYGNGPVISGVSFDIRTGETFGLVGLNGAGKTTLIKIILGLMEASAGGVEVFGKKTLDPESKSKIAYLPEKFEPPPFLNGLEFVKFSLDLYKRAYREEAVMEAADRLALARDALKRRVNTYSKGMRQKTGLMGTWLTECPLLILDEPTSGLDPRARVLVKDEIVACRDKGMTVFMSSHILADMDEICDRIAVIHEGGLRFLGTPAELKKAQGQEYLERAFLKLIDDKTKDKTKVQES
ncbi:MAG: ATP-binding cassette domain-containing protein [Alphaproteobacteria bacterium]|nr:ATP-binding cassette domain-containing protein [Alphaproteobacteria bacterium]